MAENRKFSAIFCDDIRHEINGKVSLIGCYSGLMYVQSFPANLPKLCVHVTASTGIDDPFDSLLSFTVLKDAEVLTKTDLDGAQLSELAAQAPGGIPNPQGIFITSGFEFSPLPLNEPCTIQVLLETNGQVFTGGRLRILPMPETSQI